MLKRISDSPWRMFGVGVVIGLALGALAFAMLVSGSGITVLP